MRLLSHAQADQDKLLAKTIAANGKERRAQNDEIFIIILGDKALAEAYAVIIEGAYQH